MSNSAVDMYDLSLDQCATLIAAVGHERTVLVQGETGSGKTSLAKMLAKLTGMVVAYVDCTTKTLGDLMLPKMKVVNPDGSEQEMDYVKFVAHEEFLLHLGKPIIIMLDELGKAQTSVKVALTRLILERTLGNNKLPEGSIVFATTNLAEEGVGDMLQAHQYNRITTVTARKPTAMEWIEWGINNGVDHTLMGFVKENPHVLQSFREVKDPEANPYIFHPKAQRRAFVTGRSLEAASDILKKRDNMDSQTVTAALMGTIGARAAMDLMAFVSMADKLPKLAEVKDDPTNALVPESAAAVCMVVFRTLSTMGDDWSDKQLTNWVTYMNRLPKEAQGLFANGVRSPKYAQQSKVMRNTAFTNWAIANNYMFAADKK
jgi:MoxR-like ATPase